MTAAEFRVARKRLGLSTAQLGAAIGVTARSVRRWEAGKHPVPRWAEIAVALASAPRA